MAALGAGRTWRSAHEWDLDGSGAYPVKAVLIGPADRRATATLVQRFAKPGTYFVTLRAAAQRDGGTPFARIQNLGRARVVVT